MIYVDTNISVRFKSAPPSKNHVVCFSQFFLSLPRALTNEKIAEYLCGSALQSGQHQLQQWINRHRLCLCFFSTCSFSSVSPGKPDQWLGHLSFAKSCNWNVRYPSVRFRVQNRIFFWGKAGEKTWFASCICETCFISTPPTATQFHIKIIQQKMNIQQGKGLFKSGQNVSTPSQDLDTWLGSSHFISQKRPFGRGTTILA